ncbi:unnamed protein product [Rotaria magnacalcarata]|uniref:C2H2-type domain-containing protein n=1 Tax=Rotaria magnacalcarata TaxID=392030 RepID=A0A8S2MQ99_9BILA|nr:unnamed protein product [Rotaria magnacalcarata]
MLERFKPSMSAAKTQLKERTQQSSEPLLAYYDDIIDLSKQVDSNRPLHMIVDYLQDGIRHELKIHKNYRMKPLLKQQSIIPPQPHFAHLTAATDKPLKKSDTSRRLNHCQQTFEHTQSSIKPRPYHPNSSVKLQPYYPCLICNRTNHRTIDCYNKEESGCYKCDLSTICLTIQDNTVQTTTTPLVQSNTTSCSYVRLLEKTTTPPYSKSTVNATVQQSNSSNMLFESSPRFYRKTVLLPNALIQIKHSRTRLTIVNTRNQPYTLSSNTCLGTISSSSSICTIPSSQNSTSTRNKSSRIYNRSTNPSHRCYVCHRNFLSQNSLYHHLRTQYHLSEPRDQIETLTQHIEPITHRKTIQDVLWKYGKVFDIREASTINITLNHAIESGKHRPIYTQPYRRLPQDHRTITEETDKLLNQDQVEPSTSPWCSPIVLVRKKDGTIRFCVDYRKLNDITLKDSFPLPYEILQLLHAYNFRLSFEKCTIAINSINYLDHHICRGDIRPNNENIRGLLGTSTPKETFRFLKAAEYYRKFIPNFSCITGPLYKYNPSSHKPTTTNKSTPFKLSTEEQNAFEQIKHILTSDLVLRLPNNQLPFKIQTDAAQFCIGVVLLQTYPEGDRPVCFMSKKFTGTQ